MTKQTKPENKDEAKEINAKDKALDETIKNIKEQFGEGAILKLGDATRVDVESIPTGYILVDGGKITSVQYISNTIPIPADKNDIAASTAIAGEMLGMKLIYMDAGSGAKKAITENMIEKVSKSIEAPLIIGGGITNPEKAYLNCKSGADVIVVGNAIEKDPSLIKEMAAAVHSVAVKV